MGLGRPGKPWVGQAAAATAVEPALRQFEVERSRRVLKISVRSYFMGSVLQASLPPVRSLVLSTFYKPKRHMHTFFSI
jgi:hypothetical protein